MGGERMGHGTQVTPFGAQPRVRIGSVVVQGLEIDAVGTVANNLGAVGGGNNCFTFRYIEAAVGQWV